MVRVRSGADTDPEPILESLRARRGLSGAKLDGYLAARDDMLRGRTEAQFLETARRVGPYLTVTAGIALERAHQGVDRRDDRLAQCATGKITLTVSEALTAHADS